MSKSVVMLAFLCSFLFQTFLFAVDVPVFAGINSPFNFRAKGAVTGVTVDILESILKENNIEFSEKNIVLDSWSSVFSQAIVTQNSILITATRLPEREAMFQWIGPITDVQLGIISKKSANVSLKDVKDLQGYRIVSVKNTAAERAFVKLGGDVNALVRVSTPKQAYKMLEYDRVNAVIATDLPFVYDAVNSGMNIDEYELAFLLKKAPYFIVAHKAMDPKIVEGLQKSLDKLKEKDAQGMSPYQMIFYKYFKQAKLASKAK